MGLLAIVIAIVGSSYYINSQKEAKNNDIRVAKAKEIAEVSDLVEIDKDSLGSDMYIEYMQELRLFNSTDLGEKIEGIYIGALANRIPQGYGVFCFEDEKNEDGIKVHASFMLLGEWENGNLKKGSTVEFRYFEHSEDVEDNIYEGKYTFNDTWGSRWFIHDEAEGTMSFQSIAKSDGESIYTFTGKVKTNEFKIISGIKKDSDGNYEEGEFENGRLVKGKRHFRDGSYDDGQFLDDELYNGTSYNADGSVNCYYVNGKWKSADR